MKKTSHIIVLALGLSLVGCGGGGGGGGGETPVPPEPGDIVDTTAPSLTAQTPAGRLIQTDTAISIHFDESIDTTSFTLGGSLAAESDGGVWSQTDVIDDTLTITPTTSWSVDTGRTLVINLKDLAGNAMSGFTISHDVYTGTLYYVSSAAADDSGDGLTHATAKQTIMAAVNAATSPATVVVNAGDYPVSYSPDTRVWLVEGVSLYGGYSADFNTRTLGSSTIVDESTFNGTAINPNFAVLGNKGITSATLVDGFTLQGSTQSGAQYTSAIRTRFGAAPTVQNNTIHGGSGITVTYGMYNNAASPSVQNNTIDGGSSDVTYGMYNDAASPTVQHNTIDGGSGNNTGGMVNNGFESMPSVQYNTISGGNGLVLTIGIHNINAATPAIQNNTINGGGGNKSYGMNNSDVSLIVQNNTLNGGSGTASYGMDNQNSEVTIQNNTIHGGSGGIQTFGMLNTNSTLTLINNIIHGGDNSDESRGIDSTSTEIFIQNNTIHGGSGIDESWAISHSSTWAILDNNILIAEVSNSSICYEGYLSAPDSMQNNDFVGCEFTYRRYVVGPPAGYEWFNTIEEVNALPGVSNNIAIAPVFVDLAGGNYHFSASSPTAVTAGGLNGVDEGWGFSDDKDGIIRPAAGSAWAIGAYQPN